MKRILHAAAATLVLLFTACSDPAPKDPTTGSEDHMHEHTWACPMHPEITGHKGDKCSICGMPLEEIDEGTASNEYVMKFRMEPSTISAGEEAKFFFTPGIKGNESAAVPLDVVHDKKIHLIIVSNDLSYFDHVHPEFQADGSYLLKAGGMDEVARAGAGNAVTSFPNGGDYTLFADYQPTGAKHQLEKIGVKVEGATTPVKVWNQANLKSSSNGFSVQLQPEGGIFHTGGEMHIDAPVMYKGKIIPAEELDHFLGARAHMVVIGAADMSYLHVHPEVENGNLHLHVSFETPGFYRAWIQFSYKGEVQTLPFVLDVVKGTGEMPDVDHAHHHDDQHNH